MEEKEIVKTNYHNTLLKPGAFRMFLAILVILFHASRYLPFGHVAVNTFFILSGYWIYRIYDEFYSKQQKPYLTFLFSRIARIYPLYYLCMILAVLITVVNSNILGHQVKELLTFNNLFATITIIPYNFLDEKLLPSAWSLGVEMQFYLVVPLLIHLIKKLNIIILTISILTVSVFASFSTQSITQSVMPYLIFFFIGMLIWETKPVTSTKTLINSFIVIIGVIIIHYSVPFLRDAIFIKKTIVGNINYVFYFYNLLPLLFIPMIIFSLNQKSDVADRRLGDLSYTVYLFHWLPFCIYSYYFSNNFLELRLIAFGGYILILSVGSYLIYNLFEKKLELWRKNLFVKN